ncbi:hypothetical protein RHIZ_07130 [Rhizobium skierniewicense]|uniref:hypothetical protein n=1 Tax=Rhizobium skierniewicense TaxID=984260 RepID=UPI001FAD10A3|nr:hypothetical protein [Rhizobium skierniewicense]MCI9865714.1 hypothetical protein [Rhizobium skierniewicense]
MSRLGYRTRRILLNLGKGVVPSLGYPLNGFRANNIEWKSVVLAVTPLSPSTLNYPLTNTMPMILATALDLKKAKVSENSGRSPWAI